MVSGCFGPCCKGSRLFFAKGRCKKHTFLMQQKNIKDKSVEEAEAQFSCKLFVFCSIKLRENNAVQLHTRLPTMELFVKTSGKRRRSAENIFFFTKPRVQRGQTGMITEHLCLLSGGLGTNVPVAHSAINPRQLLCVHACVRVCASPITLLAAGIQGIKESSGRQQAEAVDEGVWWVGESRQLAGSEQMEEILHRVKITHPSLPCFFVLQVKAPTCKCYPTSLSSSPFRLLIKRGTEMRRR